ncbi:hypothetical protein A3742_07955 [Oleiphilus sp. HI0071]|uniref:HlyD family secretion protein n=2 Tax=Oleiphilus TaxID=141450 RepID=UPI0007C347C9|nr:MULTISPECIES: hypothetical protein [unclassified Oleiphilus]KZY72612.1 hypothetical protein A3737_10940 [Oleiphilus sp. HI0065]KZY82809.1 hypothetical protein A3742_07955 [Oleiphilus sp. HI0071]KZZ04880.1 hypothetical protein A3744_09415 [Oleiphilus sp. HI0073]KZZ43816.1 hypothetical protein A3758_04335 [Oleiphilus sp. HI0118]KZZ48762.1 hypothetical protein A3760_22920 [Oleiphilus sp. HI0122]KZZ72280.1 hypothetical protein A3765_13220 [Oleiphilus sp. HI0130]KZZ80870.1 hypothetical protein
MKVEFKHEKQHDPTRQTGFKVSYAPAKRATFKMRWYLLVLLVVSPVVYVFWHFFNADILVKADGILTSEPVTIFARDEGVVVDIGYQQGDRITRGAPLIEMRSSVFAAEIALLENRLAEYEESVYRTSLKIEDVSDRKVALYDNAKKTSLGFKKEISDKKYAQHMPLSDRVALELAKLEIEDKAVEAERESILSHARETSSFTASVLLDLEKELSRAKAKQSQLNIYAHAESIINEVFVSEGEFVVKASPLMSLRNREQPVVNVYLQPNRLEYAKQGSKATIRFPDGKKYIGEVKVPVKVVDKIPAMLSGPFETSKAAIKVQIDIDEPIDEFVEGLPVEVRFHYGNAHPVLQRFW